MKTGIVLRFPNMVFRFRVYLNQVPTSVVTGIEAEI